MWGYFAALFLLVLTLLGARAFGFTTIKPWTRHFDTLQTFLTICAVMLAAVWYFFERPQAAKLDLSQTVQVVPLGGKHLMLLIEVSPKNLGGTALNFAKSPYSIEVGQVTPLTVEPYEEAFGANSKARPRKVWAAENWSPMARIAYSREGVGTGLASEKEALTSFIEAGETENLYFRAFLTCKPHLRIYVTSRFEKPQMFWERWMRAPQLHWVKQTLLDLSGQCPSEETVKLKKDHRRRAK